MSTARPMVLLIDDHAATRELVTDLLEQEGYAVESCSSSRDGLTRLGQGPIDLILTDLMLPDMSGLELCRQIRVRSTLARVPIVLYSAATGPGWKEASFTAGADDYVSKPFNIETLLDRVGTHLKQTAGGR